MGHMFFSDAGPDRALATRLAQGLAERLRETPAPGAPFSGMCPFSGLEVFREDDARFLFGRDAETRDKQSA
jgi:hypothetical protein